MTRKAIRAAACCLWAMTTLPLLGQPALDNFELGGRPQLINCDEQPCIRIEVNALDRFGESVPLGISAEQARRNFRVAADDLYCKPEECVFHASYNDGDAGHSYSLLLLDISGSMRSLAGRATRFETARAAVRRYISNVRPGKDFVAIAPFESHRVIERIEDAPFLDDPEGLKERLAGLPFPAKGNTALYQAIVTGLRRLQQKRKEAGSQVSMIVLTDGKNDVQPQNGDDTGLESDLRRVLDLEREMGIEVTTIGFGARGQANFDETALRKLAYPSEGHYYYAADSARLNEVFDAAWRKLTNRIQIAFGPVRERKNELSGRDLAFSLRFTTREGRVVESRSPQPGSGWDGVAMVWHAAAFDPAFEDTMNQAEQKDYLRLHPMGNGVWWKILRWRLTILLIFGAILFFFWFVLPRVIWPARYAGTPALAGASVGRPSLSAPSWSGPAVRGPSVSGPSVSGPSVRGPSVSPPRFSAPVVQPPRYAGPSAAVPRTPSASNPANPSVTISPPSGGRYQTQAMSRGPEREGEPRRRRQEGDATRLIRPVKRPD